MWINFLIPALSSPLSFYREKIILQPFPSLPGGGLHRWRRYPSRGDQRPCAEDFEGSTDRPQQSWGELTDSSTSDRCDTQRKYRYRCLQSSRNHGCANSGYTYHLRRQRRPWHLLGSQWPHVAQVIRQHAQLRLPGWRDTGQREVPVDGPPEIRLFG